MYFLLVIVMVLSQEGTRIITNRAFRNFNFSRCDFITDNFFKINRLLILIINVQWVTFEPNTNRWTGRLTKGKGTEEVTFRAVIKRWGPFPRLLRTCGPHLLSTKEIPSCLIPRLHVVFTRELEILVTALKFCV